MCKHTYIFGQAFLSGVMRCGGIGTLRCSRRKASGIDLAGANLGRPLSSVMTVSSAAASGASLAAWAGSMLISMSSPSSSVGSGTLTASIATSSASSSGLRCKAVGAGILSGIVLVPGSDPVPVPVPSQKLLLLKILVWFGAVEGSQIGFRREASVGQGRIEWGRGIDKREPS